MVGESPEWVVSRARDLERVHGHDPRFPLGVAWQEIIKPLQPSKLPRRSRRQGIVVDHRFGPDLIDHVADAVDHYRSEFARRFAVGEDQVLPMVMIDPAQRFAGGAGESEKRAIDAILGAADDVLCRELGCVVVATSDTTKAAARESTSIDVFLSKDPAALAADVFAGTQGIAHHASVLIALSMEKPPAADARTARQWARVLKNRDGGASEMAFPFGWERICGRFLAQLPEPLRAPPEGVHYQHRGHDRPRGMRDFIPPGTDRILHD
jgi:hypothetical protein